MSFPQDIMSFPRDTVLKIMTRYLGYMSCPQIIHPTKFLIGHISISFFLTKTTDIILNFCLNMCILMGNSLAVVSEKVIQFLG